VLKKHNNNMPNETEKLADMFPDKQTNSPDPFAPEKVEDKVEEKDTEAELEAIKNRRERRLEAKYQAEREANIALTERIKVLSEVEKFRKETPSAGWKEKSARIYGTDKAENAEATLLLQEAIAEAAEEKATEKVEKLKEELSARETESENELAREEDNVESMMETVEDEFGVNLAAGSKARNAFIDEMEKLSPKRNGEIVEYADPIAVWEIVQEKMNKPNSRSRELASRSMTRSSGSSEANEENKATEQYLKEQGLI
jgi:hypothetical protein